MPAEFSDRQKEIVCKRCSSRKVGKRRWYFVIKGQVDSGVICPKCYLSKRYTENKPKLLLQQKAYNLKNKELVSLRHKIYYKKNRAILLKKVNERQQKNHDTYLDYQKNYHRTHKVENKLYRHQNRVKFKNYEISRRAKRNKTHKQRRLTDVQFTLSSRLRSRFRGLAKSGSSVRDLGCTTTYLKMYLESKFQLGMSWETYGRTGWHIDHIKPLCQFDLTNRAEFLQACHYTNLQPLWAIDNLSKGGR